MIKNFIKSTKNQAVIIKIMFVIAFGEIIFLLVCGQFTPFLAALGIQSSQVLPTISEAKLKTMPNLSIFPTKLDDLVIVAHYDDESLACGGLIASEIKNNRQVGVVFVTFSQGTDADQRNWFGLKKNYRWLQWKFINKIRLRAKDRTDYALKRESESEKALDYLGVPKNNRLFLRYPDESLINLLAAPATPIRADYLDPEKKQVLKYSGEEFITTLKTVINHSQAKRLITHFPDDTESDHRAIGRLIESLVKDANNPPEIWSFLVHWNNHDAAWAPPQYANESVWLKAVPNDYFQPPQGSPTNAITATKKITIDWEQDFLTWKRALIKNYSTQIKYDPEFPFLFAKHNELFWNLQNKELIEVNYE